ncbi:hypothetical protein T265_03438 [Opisthorchis viverrini]|uniref:Uncharacterized protein n=1 Tax=Opisthorchis viverrini TaxID=6198 RepID=A0A074ZRL8_OPIVI|nr:hypothetical protein T265_03438 [Opisthorchis viverrini]KER30068.1 hypothetical protein T265_03438 [Opisthorchis viverrini]
MSTATNDMDSAVEDIRHLYKEDTKELLNSGDEKMLENPMEVETPTSYPNAVDILLCLLRTHSDPQLRGQLCVLFGQLICASLIHDVLLEGDGSPVLTKPYDVLLGAIDRVLSSSVESSETT